jgi:hypothetical protein
MNKYEQLIEHIINDEEGKARALFHEIVVEKSRDIYESLMDEEYTEEGIGGDQVGGLVDEITMDETDGIGEGEDEMDHEFSLDHEMGDELGGEIGGEMGGEEDLETKVMNLEDELEALRAEFAELSGHEAGEDHEDEMSDMDSDDEEYGDEEYGDEESDEEPEEESDEEESYAMESRQSYPKTAVDLMREYVEKISTPSNTEFTPVGTGAGGDKPAGNTKNPLAGKNDMGGTTQNIAKGGSNSAPDGTSANKGEANQYKKGQGQLDGAGKFENVPGANAGKAFSNKAKAKSGEGQTTDGSVPTNKRSIEQGGN